MPLQATSGAASYDAFGGGVPVVPNYIEDVFRTHLYNGDTGGFIFASSGVSIVSGGMMWVKSRGSATNNYIFSPSLTSANHYLNTNTTAAQSNSGVSSNNFEAVDNGGGMRFGGAYSGISSSATGPFASWTFRKQPKFFDVVTFTQTSTSSNFRVNHSLGSVPACIIIKCTSTTSGWYVYHRSLGRSQYMRLEATSNAASSTDIWGTSDPTSTDFGINAGGLLEGVGTTYVAYLFAHDAGGFGLTGTDNVISCGSYTGTGAAGNAVTLGYEPQWLLIKRSSVSGNDWWMLDNMRGLTMGIDADLRANLSQAEENAVNYVDPSATGFSVQTTNAALNTSGSTYIYIAIRRGPMKVPTSGTSVFLPSTAPATTPFNVGFPPDLALWSVRDSTGNKEASTRLQGGSELFTNTTAAEASGYDIGWASKTNFWYQNVTGGSMINWMFRRAPSFFDVVCYTGTGVTHTETHNLGVAPELIIVKRRASAAVSWAVYAAPLTASYVGFLDLNNKFQADNMWNSTAPTSTAFTVGAANAQVNASGSTYVAYLFATCAGVSKVGSYTGTGTTLQVNCGFTSGARFVLIKRTDSTGDWYVWDSARGIVAGNDSYLLLNSTAAEVTNTDYIDTYSAGFEISSTAPAAINASGGSFIFFAVA